MIVRLLQQCFMYLVFILGYRSAIDARSKHKKAQR